MVDFRKYYRSYMYMKDLLKTDFTHNYIEEALKDADKGEDSLIGKTNEKVIDMDWVIAIEEALPYIRKAIDEQRRFIKQVENVVRIEKAKKIGTDSVKHLAQHTSFIAKVEGDKVTPNKILTIEREESFAIYENRVLLTLIHKALRFVDDKYSKMKDVPNDSYNNISVERHLELNQQKLDFNINYVHENHETMADDLDVIDVSELSDFDRIRRIRQSLNECLATPLMKDIAKETHVRPPLTQTNLLKKNPNFKKAVELWNFLDTYKKKGFEIVGEEYSGKMTDETKQDIYFSMGFQHFMMSITTNSALRRMLQEKYEEENALMEEEANKPERIREMVMQAKIDAIRKEEMEIRLKEIREREKKIVDLTAEIRSLKITLDQKEQQILTLKGQVSALKDELDKVKKELQDTKLKLLAAQKEIEQLKEENIALKAEITQLKDKIDDLEDEIAELNKTIKEQKNRILELEQENEIQQIRIREQDKIIEDQIKKIKECLAKVAFYEKKIEEIKDELRKTKEDNARKTEQVINLTELNESLTNEIETEREQNKAEKEKMLSEFEEKSKKAEEEFNSRLLSKDKELEAAAAAHDEYVIKLNAENDSKIAQLMSRHTDELAQAKSDYEKSVASAQSSHDAFVAKLNEKHADEILRVQRSVDKRVEQAEAEAEKLILNAEKEAETVVVKAKENQSTKVSDATKEMTVYKAAFEEYRKRPAAFKLSKYVDTYEKVIAGNKVYVFSPNIKTDLSQYIINSTGKPLSSEQTTVIEAEE
ncbi:MAG: hypothetical protein UH080_02035 [Ruminococcus sp.]|nr:hypothetical protein [Ruminococcus sp.]